MSQPELSVVIVSYNVSHFLQQTLQSLFAALHGIDAEVWVVDNASADDSVQMVVSKYPQVKLIANKHNIGFAKANNQALKQASGQYQLLLNPDIVLAESTLRKCLDFMHSHPNAGGLGVRMIDGSGIYLPESKRGLPTPWVSFCKIIGLTDLMPTSPTFARYYMGHLSAVSVQEVDVLSGAFMLMPKAVLDQIGLLDEDFFMYGEDVDLSYRIQLGGYKNYYLPDTTIIHYKGESTKKGSLKYVKVFYSAMAIFARKHFVAGGQQAHHVNEANGGSQAQQIILDIAFQIAINLRASLSIVSRFWAKIKEPLLDAILLWVGMYILKEYWQDNHKRVPGDYPSSFMLQTVPTYIVAWLGASWVFGGYARRPKADAIIKGLLVGMVIISATTNFFDDWRYSKALILLGTGWGIAAMLGWRLLAQLGQYGNLSLGEHRSKRIILVAEPVEANRLSDLINAAQVNATVVGVVNQSGDGAVSKLEALVNTAQTLHAQEIIFSGNSLSNEAIISIIGQRWMGILPSFRIVPAGSDLIIGSSDKNHQGDYYNPESSYALLQYESLRKKRVFDIGISLVMILAGPLFSIIRQANLAKLYAAAFGVLGGGTWVAPHYEAGLSLNIDNADNEDNEDKLVIMAYAKRMQARKLSQPSHAVFTPSAVAGAIGPLAAKVDALYIREYSVWMDLQYVWQGLAQL